MGRWEVHVMGVGALLMAIAATSAISAPSTEYPRLHAYATPEAEELKKTLLEQPYAGLLLVVSEGRGASGALYASVEFRGAPSHEDRPMTRDECCEISARILDTCFGMNPPVERVDLWAIPPRTDPVEAEKSREVLFSLSCSRSAWRRLRDVVAGAPPDSSALEETCGAVYLAAPTPMEGEPVATPTLVTEGTMP